MIRMKNYNSFLFPTNPAAITAQFQQRLYIYHHQSCLPSITITWRRSHEDDHMKTITRRLYFFFLSTRKFLLLGICKPFYYLGKKLWCKILFGRHVLQIISLCNGLYIMNRSNYDRMLFLPPPKTFTAIEPRTCSLQTQFLKCCFLKPHQQIC